MNNISVYCLKYAESLMPESMAFAGGDINSSIPIAFSFYLIITNDKKILVDVGCNSMPDFKLNNFTSPISVLGQMGLTTSDITDVVITHAHNDHIGLLKQFESSLIHITSEEYEFAKGYMPENAQLNILKDKYDLSPDITIINWGGHSKGSSIVEIKTKEKIHVLAGDECYTNANIKQRLCSGICYNKEKSEAFVKKYSDDKYRVHTCHDISLKSERII